LKVVVKPIRFFYILAHLLPWHRRPDKYLISVKRNKYNFKKDDEYISFNLVILTGTLVNPGRLPREIFSEVVYEGSFQDHTL